MSFSLSSLFSASTIHNSFNSSPRQKAEHDHHNEPNPNSDHSSKSWSPTYSTKMCEDCIAAVLYTFCFCCVIRHRWVPVCKNRHQQEPTTTCPSLILADNIVDEEGLPPPRLVASTTSVKKSNSVSKEGKKARMPRFLRGKKASRG